MSSVSLDSLAKRIQQLEDVQAIKQLKVVYARACDDFYNPDKMAEVFSENAVWDGGESWGRH